MGYSPWSHKELDMLARDILLQKFKHWSTGLNINTEGNFGLFLYLLKDLELTVHTYIQYIHNTYIHTLCYFCFVQKTK